jgi:chromosome segregation ATPase
LLKQNEVHKNKLNEEKKEHELSLNLAKKDIEDTKKEYLNFVDRKNKESENIEIKIEDLNKKLKVLEERHIKDNEVFERSKKEKEEELLKLGEEIDSNLLSLYQIKNERQKIEDDLSVREELVTKREGDVSTKENWIKEKEDTLRTAKEEFEKYTNKKIPVII